MKVIAAPAALAALLAFLLAGRAAAQDEGSAAGTEAAKPPEKQATPAVPDAPIAGFDDGFFLQTPDRKLRLTIGGLLQVRGDFFERGLDDRVSEFELVRMRLEFGGAFFDRYLFNLEPNFGEDDVELEEAWVGAKVGKRGARLLVGRMKEPFGLEEMLPRKHFDFPTFSILNQFSPAEDHGLTLLGGSLDAPWEYGVALYNGTGGDDLNDDKDVAGRLVVRPWADDSSSPARRLQLGGAATFGREDADLDGAELETEAKVPFLVFQPGSMADGDRTRLGLEAAWLAGPFALIAEAIALREELTGPAGGVTSDTRGWYAAASWVITGETKTFRGVRPDRPWLTPEQSEGCGAFQLALRWSELFLDDDLVDGGLVAANAFPDAVRTLDAGVNWYASAYSKVMLHVLRTLYADDVFISGDRRSKEDALLLQFQVQF